MKISWGTWACSFGPYASHPLALDEVAVRAAAAGYDGLELSGYPPHVTLDAYPTPQSRSVLRQRFADLGLGLSGYSPDFSSVNPIPAENRERYLDLFKRHLEMAADLASPTLRVDTGGAPGSVEEHDYYPALSRVADLWREGAEECKKAGVRLVWEFEPGYLFNKYSEVIALHDRVGHPWFQLLFDTSHAYMSGVIGARQQGRIETLDGGVAEFLEKLDGRIGAIHVVDSDGTLQADETSTHRPLGEGYLVWRKLLPKLASVRSVDWWCLDLSFWDGAADLIETSLQSLKKLMAANLTGNEQSVRSL
jgi:sugar phosphate isomerase/epimerase